MIVRGSGSTLWDSRRPGVPRRDGRSLVRQRRVRQAGAGRGDRAPDRAPLLLPRLLVDGHGGARAAGRARARLHARAHVEGVLRVERLGRQRHPGEARLVLQQRARPTREEEARLAGPRVPRRDGALRRAHGPGQPPRGIRPPAPDDPARAGAPPALGGDRGNVGRRVRAVPRGRPRAADPPRRPRHRRGLHRRAAPGGRRRARPSPGLLPRDPGGASPPRRPADRRRGGLRLRTPRLLVRERALRDRAGPDHRREGFDLRLHPALGLPRLRARLERRRRCVEGRLRARLHVHRPSRRCGRGDGEPRHHRARRARRPGGGARRKAQRAPPRGVRRPPARRRGPRDRV